MLPASQGQQSLWFLTFALLGIALGVVYDVLRAVRRRLRLRRLGTGLLDGLFCLTALVGFLLTMLWCTDGRLRGYLGLGLAAGLLLYRSTVSHSVCRLALCCLELGGQALARLKKTLLWMFSFPRGN